jgi:hypothetical protein
MAQISDLRSLYRTHHIAYAIAKGNKYEDIERNPRTEPNWIVIDSLLEILGGER